MPLSVGDTFLLSGTGGMANPEGCHLMVCLMVDQPKDVAVIVPIVTLHERSDRSCVLKIGGHDFIKHDSCASYDFAQAVSWSEINREVERKKLRLRSPVSDEVLKRLQVGFVLSDETPPYIYAAGSGQKLELWLKHRGYIK